MKSKITLSKLGKDDKMIRSMTGFGRERRIIGGREYLVEIRSVNNRYFECNVKLPRQYAYLEDALKGLLKDKISRGKVEVSLSVTSLEGKEEQVTVNNLVVEAYLNAMRETAERFGLEDDITLSSIFRMSDVFNIVRPEVNEDEIKEAVLTVAAAALDKFVQMRETEGERLKADLLDKAAGIEKMVEQVEAYSPETVEAYRKKLYDKMCEVLGSAQIDEQRILTEAAIFSEKVAVDEETVRLHSHFSQFRQMLEESVPVGRKLDFQVQELNRETNTIGSKCQDLRVTRIVVDMKSEIEKIREQIQNIE